MQSLVTPRRKWVRRVVLVVILLVVGAMVNVGVAWGCVLSVSYTHLTLPTILRV